MATIDTKQKEQDQELQEAWLALWLFVNTQIRWNSQDIDFDDFFKKGDKLFEIKERT